MISWQSHNIQYHVIYKTAQNKYELKLVKIYPLNTCPFPILFLLSTLGFSPPFFFRCLLKAFVFCSIKIFVGNTQNKAKKKSRVLNDDKLWRKLNKVKLKQRKNSQKSDYHINLNLTEKKKTGGEGDQR